MSHFQWPSATALLAEINTANSTTLQSTDVSFSNPQVISGGMWQGVASDRNTAVRVTGSGVNYQGNTVIQYNRKDISQLANLPSLQMAVYNINTVWDLIQYFAYWTGIKFAQSDLINDPVTSLTNGAGPITVRADPNSLGWINSVTINVTQGGLGLDNAVQTTALAGLNYPVADASAPPTTATYGPVYTYPYDFSANTPTYLTWQPGVITAQQAATLVSALQAVDVGAGAALWNSVASGSAGYTAWNLTGATIVSNGLNNANTMPTNPAFKYVMVLQLGAQNTVPNGLLYLQYNDPYNPNSF
jgi:hypothetical protein